LDGIDQGPADIHDVPMMFSYLLEEKAKFKPNHAAIPY